MKWLPVEDVEQIVRLVSEAGDPTVEIPVPERKRMLLTSVAEMVGADAWLWSSVALNPQIPGDAWTTCMIDGGWASEEERVRFMHVLSDPNARELQSLPEVYPPAHHLTLGREYFVSKVGEKRFEKVWSATGMPYVLLSMCAVAEFSLSIIGLYRRRGKDDFSERDRVVVHAVFQQVDWLHHHGSDVPAKDKILRLSRREREVLVFLLGGDSLKQVAQNMKLSEHTVGDYVKNIYKHFEVSSRAELLAHFIAGGRPQGKDSASPPAIVDRPR